MLTLLIVFWGPLDGRRVRGDGRRFRTNDAIRQTRRRLALQRDPRRGEWTVNKGDRRHQGTDNTRRKDLIEENKVGLKTSTVSYDITKEDIAILRESKTKQHVEKQKNYDHDISEEGSGNDPGEAKVKKPNPQNNTVFINGRKAVIKKRKRGRKLDNKKVTEQKHDSDDLAGKISLSLKGRRVRVKKRRRQLSYRKEIDEQETGVPRGVMHKEEIIPKPTLEYQNQNDLIKVYKSGQGQARINATSQFSNFPVFSFSSDSQRPSIHTNERPFLPSMEISNKPADESLPQQLPFNLGSYKWSHHLADLQYMDFSSFDAQFDPKENLYHG